MPGWCPCCPSSPGKENEGENANADQPKAKRLRLSLNKKSMESARFDFSTSEVDVERHRKGLCPQNTKASNDRALCNFEQRRQARNALKSGKSCAEDILLNDDVSQVDRWLCTYLHKKRQWVSISLQDALCATC